MPNPPTSGEPERTVSEKGSGMSFAAPQRVPARRDSPGVDTMPSTSTFTPASPSHPEVPDDV